MVLLELVIVFPLSADSTAVDVNSTLCGSVSMVAFPIMLTQFKYQFLIAIWLNVFTYS